MRFFSFSALASFMFLLLLGLVADWEWLPVEVMLPRLLGVGQARCYYTNGHFCLFRNGSRAWLRPAAERSETTRRRRARRVSAANQSPDPKSGVLLIRRLGNKWAAGVMLPVPRIKSPLLHC